MIAIIGNYKSCTCGRYVSAVTTGDVYECEYCGGEIPYIPEGRTLKSNRELDNKEEVELEKYNYTIVFGEFLESKLNFSRVENRIRDPPYE